MKHFALYITLVCMCAIIEHKAFSMYKIIAWVAIAWTLMDVTNIIYYGLFGFHNKEKA